MSMVVSLSEEYGLRTVPGCAFSTSRKRGRRARLAAGLLGSLALFPLVAVQGVLTRCRMPCLPPLLTILRFPALASRAAMRRFAPQPRVHWHA